MNPIPNLRAVEQDPGEDAIRTPPHNLEAEQALLGAILVNNEAHDRVSQFLEAHHFFDPLHQQIYETAAKLIASGQLAGTKSPSSSRISGCVRRSSVR